MIRQLRAIVKGRVQGVGYRAWIASEATSRNLGGSVKNRDDGSVEIVAVGPELILNDLVEAARRGPPLADVMDVEVAWGAADAPMHQFKILR